MLITPDIERSNVVRDIEIPGLLQLEPDPDFTFAIGSVVRRSPSRTSARHAHYPLAKEHRLPGPQTWPPLANLLADLPRLLAIADARRLRIRAGAHVTVAFALGAAVLTKQMACHRRGPGRCHLGACLATTARARASG